MFYKVENGRLIKAPQKSLKVFIANPADEHYKFFGYTDEIIEDPLPDDSCAYETWYEQTGGVIYKHYRKIEEIL